MNTIEIIEHFERLREYGYGNAQDVENELVYAALPEVRRCDAEDRAKAVLLEAIKHNDSKAIDDAKAALQLAWTGDQKTTAAVAEDILVAELMRGFRINHVWSRAATMYNGCGESLMAMFDAVDPDVDLGSIIEDDRAIELWRAYPAMKEQQDNAIEPLILILELGGKKFDRKDPLHYIAAFVEMDENATFDDAVQAWKMADTSRAGRWKALREAGCRPKAIARLEDFNPPAAKAKR